MTTETLADKLHDLEHWVMSALEKAATEARLNSARKAGEAICKAIILAHCGSENGLLVINGTRNMDGSDGLSKPLDFSGLIQLVCKSGQKVTPLIPEANSRKQLNARLDLIRTHTNPASHDHNVATSLSSESSDDHLPLVLQALAQSVVSTYRFLNRQLPPELGEKLRLIVPHLQTVSNSFEDVRGAEIVRLYYPNQRIVEHSSPSEWKDRVSYEFVAVEVARHNVVGFLFLKRNISLLKTLNRFAGSLTTSLTNLFICSPVLVSRETGKQVDRLNSIQESYSQLNCDKLPETPELYYIRDFLWQYCLSKHASELSSVLDSEEPFVDQALYQTDSTGIPQPLDTDSLQHAVRLIDAPETDEPVILIAGPAGVGKSTFCEHLVRKVNTLDRKCALLISSTDLRDATPEATITSVTELYALYARMTDTVQSNILAPENLELNISCGNLVLIIDGLDEIESILKERFGVDSFIDSAIALNHSYNHCTIFITCRDYYLARFLKRLDISMYSLLGFNETSVSKYLAKRFPNQPIKRERAINLLQLLGRFMVSAKSHLVPLYLALVCNIVEREGEGDTSELPDAIGSNYLLAQMPIDILIHNLMRREIAKQSINITCDEYFELLREIVLSYKGRISKPQLNEYIAICFRIEPTSQDESERYRQFYVSPLLSTESGGNYFTLRYPYVETWVKARVIAHQFRALDQGHEKSAMPMLKSLLAELYYGSGELYDEVIELKSNGSVFSVEAARKALSQLISSLSESPPIKEIVELRRALSGLLYLMLGDKQKSDKRQYTERLVSLYGGCKFDYMTVFGPFFPIDFSSARVENGLFEIFTQFSRCTFPKSETVFYHSTFRDVDPGKTKSALHMLFDESCKLNEALQVFVDRSTEAIESVRKRIADDIIAVLKVGFRGGSFTWKSETLYEKKVTLKNDVRLSRLLKFLVGQGVLVAEKAVGAGTGVGYVVSELYRVSAKDAIVNTIETPQFAKVIQAAVAEFHKIVVDARQAADG